MNESSQRTLIGRLIRSRVLWALVFAVAVVAVLSWSQSLLSNKVQDRQAQFVADSVLRCAVQCYAIEGHYPSSQDGVKYLEQNYGLAIDSKRYVVYYESMGDNLLPQIQVIPLKPNSPIELIADVLGGGAGR